MRPHKPFLRGSIRKVITPFPQALCMTCQSGLVMGLCDFDLCSASCFACKGHGIVWGHNYQALPASSTWNKGGHTQHHLHGQGLLAFPQPLPGTPLSQPWAPSHWCSSLSLFGGPGCCHAPNSANPLDLAWLKIYLLVSITKTYSVLDFKIYFKKGFKI